MFEKNEYLSENFKDLDFNGVEVSMKEFDGCTFENCDFTASNFERSSFADCDFLNCNLSNLKVDYSKFSDVCFRDSKLTGIDWTKAMLSGLIISSPINFYNSILSHCSFYGLSLRDLVMEDCKSHSVDFREGDFSNSNFRYSDLSNCSFGNTNLSGADLSQATNYAIDIYRNTIKGAKFSRLEALSLLDSLEIELVNYSGLRSSSSRIHQK